MTGLLHSLNESQRLSPQQPSVAQRLLLGLLSLRSMIITRGKYSDYNFTFKFLTIAYVLHTCKIDNYGKLDIHITPTKTCVQGKKKIISNTGLIKQPPSSTLFKSPAHHFGDFQLYMLLKVKMHVTVPIIINGIVTCIL